MPKIFKTVGKHALSTGVNIANDMLEGNVNQSGSGHRRRKRTSHEQQQQQRKRQRKNRDIFN